MAGQRNSYGKRFHSESDYDGGGKKRRNTASDKEKFSIGNEDTVYRYLCPIRRIGSIIGRGGEIVKQLRLDTNAKIRIGEIFPGSEERVVTIYSSSDETNIMEDSSDHVSPAQDAFFRVHDKVIAEELHGKVIAEEMRIDDEESEKAHKVTARLLVPANQIGCIIGKGGLIVQNIRSDTGAEIRILKDEHLPTCALSSDELVQITGKPAAVKKALYKIASRLHENPSKTQHLLNSAVPSLFPPGGSVIGQTAGGAPIVGIASLMGHYGGHKNELDWPRPLYSAPRDEMSSKEFSIRFVCPTSNIGGVIGKGGSIINQIRQDSRAGIKVDSSATEGNDCLITISAKEFFEDTFSPTMDAAIRLQPRCSERVERDSGIISYTTRLLVSTSKIGCLIGKGGSIINELRRITKANVRILGTESLPKVATEDDEMVMIAGDLDVVKDALVHVATRLRANVFDREGAVSTFMPVLPYLPMPPNSSDALKYESRDSSQHGRYSGSYQPSDSAASDSYGSYGGSMVGSGGNPYGAYGGYSSGRGGSGASNYDRMSSSAPGSRRKSYGY